MNFFTGGGGDFPPRYSLPSIGRQQAVQSARPTTVRGEPPAPGEPCVVVISMGHIPEIDILRHRAEALSDYPCLVIDIGTDLAIAFDMLQAQVPENAYVVLITNVPDYERQFIRTALPAHTILDDIRGEPIDPFTPLPGLSNLRPTKVAGDLPAPGEPCVVVITLGKSAEASLLKDRARDNAEHRHYPCLVIDVGTDFNAMDVLRNCVPSNANVVLITDAPDAEVETIRAALPSQTILDDVRRESVDPFDLLALPLLDALPHLTPAHPSDPSILDEVQMEYVQAGSGRPFPGLDALPRRPLAHRVVNDAVCSTSALLTRSVLPLLPPPGLQEMLDEYWHAQAQVRDLRRDHSPLPDPVQNAAVHVTASNPADILFEALDLSPDLRESPAWQQLEQAHDLSLMGTLVTRILKASGGDPYLRASLRHLVEEVAHKPALAKRVFGVLLGGDVSCDDRVSLTWHRAELELLVQPAIDGALPRHEMFETARKVYRRKRIDELAAKKVDELNASRRAQGFPEQDEIETHLAYYFGLHELLELGGQKPNALFLGFSDVTLADIKLAREKILDREGDEIWGFFATWAPWQDVLRKEFPNDVAEIEDVLSDPQRPEKIEREVAVAIADSDVPLELHQNAITLGANQRGKAEERALWLKLTRKAWSDDRDA